ncbi:MAG: D-alanyl-D-alanine carboxypeptidase family protein [Cellulosilyticaceae bacterium]
MGLKKISPILLAAICITTNIYGAQPEAKIYGKGTVLIEKNSKRILYGYEENKPLPMASTTKIMTCILAIEKGNLEDVVTVSSRAARAPKVKLGLETGEKQRLGDLLYSLMLESHNDSAVAIAEHIGGSVENFCQMMTQKAKEIGAEHTSFETPNGLDSQNHYASPYDMALITAYAFDNAKFAEIINTSHINLPTVELKGSKPHSIQNKNRFLSMYEGAKGVKTGYTSKAGHCFVGAVHQENMDLIGVSLGAGWGKEGKSRKYTDLVKMMNYGFRNYDLCAVGMEPHTLREVAITRGKQEKVAVGTDAKVTLPLSKQEKDALKWQLVLPESIKAPVRAGDWVGRAHMVVDGQILGSVDLYCTQDVAKSTLLDELKRFIQEKFN